MAQIYKIYINETVLILTESVPNELENYQTIEQEEFDFKRFYANVKSSPVAGIYLIKTTDSKSLLQDIKSSLRIIKAAGGVVKNEKNSWLFIFRKGKWDLPKGKLDKGEKAKAAAVREVEEECGIQVTELGNKICKTYHIYEAEGKTILKKTTWYWMRADNQPNPVPQVEEDITDVKWLAPGDFMLVKQNTYPLIRDLIAFVEK